MGNVGGLRVRTSFADGKRHSRPEHVHRPHHVLPADGAFVHALAALGARDHVSALQKNTVNG